MACGFSGLFFFFPCRGWQVPLAYLDSSSVWLGNSIAFPKKYRLLQRIQGSLLPVPTQILEYWFLQLLARWDCFLWIDKVLCFFKFFSCTQNCSEVLSRNTIYFSLECFLIVNLTLLSAFCILIEWDFFIVGQLEHSLGSWFILIFNCWFIFNCWCIISIWIKCN